MHGRTHICAAVMGRETDKLSRAALVLPCSWLVNSAGIQCSLNKGPALPDAMITLPLLYVCSQHVSTVQSFHGRERSEPVWGNRDDLREAGPVQDKHKLCHFIWRQWGTGHRVCSHPHLHCLPISFTPPLSTEHKRGERRRGREEEGEQQGGQWGSGCVLSPLSVCECTDGSVVIWCVSPGTFDGLKLSSSISQHHLIFHCLCPI